MKEETRFHLKEASELSLKPEARLRLYEKMNEERRKKGEKLLKIPAKLIAQVKAKGSAVAESVGDVAKAGGQSASQMHARSEQVIHTMKDGAKSVGEKAFGAGKKSAHHGRDMVNETGQTILDSGRIMTSEVTDVVSDTLEHPLKAVVAPARLAGKGIKAGARMMKGGVKVAMSGVKGTLSVAKGGLDVGAESVKQSGEVIDSVVDVAETAMDERNKVAGAMGKGMEKIRNVKPKKDDEDEGKK